ncbi:restriction endonuclease [Burkholderia cepacia]|uniref:restriction endonuclease n=1 Tax=Burkholderia cepacia TaxID=292 RepID=UPI000F5F44C9|nr:restriction endonuclease [Burkholderia cepacia]RQZ93328.1 restriction endonuclease [Burkholderia cepacia]RQZ97839.1 restriction endonuclease [Burkholderia cepacia]
MARMWMVRGEGGSLYDAFRERGVAAIGWNQLAAHAKPGIDRKQLIDRYKSAEPQAKHGTVVSGASQVWRFVNEIQKNDWIVTYSPANRTYLVGTVTGPAEHHPDWAEQNMPLARKVQWQSQELSRDKLGTSTKNSLGATLTVFEVPSNAMADVLAALGGNTTVPEDEDDEEIADPLADVESQALERIKDRVNELDWDEMQQLVAGILRAMNYKTQISPPGSDRGKDIVASPDGFGFEHPRIVVEVKHRREQMGSQDIRSFLGGRHKDDRGLYVSTGGFSKDAQYEADRASIPLALWTLDHVVRALIEHYDKTDAETKRIIPLKRLYWPA